MYPWFVWNNIDSRSMGLWVSELPPITRPEERVSSITIPGRAGELTMLEGDEIYEAYKKEIVVTCRNEAINSIMMNWLRGSGELIISTEDQFVYKARIAAAVSFSRLGNNLSQATIAFWCQPFKYARFPSTLIYTANGTITNIGNASSRPKIKVERKGALRLGIGDLSMTFAHLPGEVVIDCDAKVITTKVKEYNSTDYFYKGDYCNIIGVAGWTDGLYRFTTEGIWQAAYLEYVGAVDENLVYIWPGAWQGDFLIIPPGDSNITLNQSATVTIDPAWRWV